MDSTYRHADLTVDQQHALLTAARTLAEEFAGAFGTETIERFLHTSYDQFAGRAVIANYLPLLAERFARQRLRVLARVEGKDSTGVPIVLFLCAHNAGRSQMGVGRNTPETGHFHERSADSAGQLVASGPRSSSACGGDRGLSS